MTETNEFEGHQPMLDGTQNEAAGNGKSKLRWVALAAAIAFTVFQIAETEMRVAELKADGFGEVAIDSVRNHAYFPMIGAIAGALIFIGIGKLLKRLLAP